MVEVLRVKGFKVSIRTRDHEPIHVHVTGQGCHVKVELKTLKTSQVRGFKPHEIERIKKVLVTYSDLLETSWESIHGNEKKDT